MTKPIAILLWLDFDRADLAPDDADSVLSILWEQFDLQTGKENKPKTENTDWESNAETFGKSLSLVVQKSAKPVLILDGFEVAQHFKKHREIYNLLERIIQHVPSLKIVVSGRAPVHALTLGGQMAQTLPLTGMPADDAKAWLIEKGIIEEPVIDRICQFAKGVPLILKLAVRLKETGDELSLLPDNFANVVIEGFLYHRILDRVINTELKPLAKDILILRSVTPEIIKNILPEHIPEGMDVNQLFEQLAQEMALVEKQGDMNITKIGLTTSSALLQLRPELRSATLKLLEINRVRDIDQRAANWYALQDLTKAEINAEYIYHLLRLGETDKAEKAWRNDCADRLQEALADLDEAERHWLQQHLHEATLDFTNTIKLWEKDGLSRIQDALRRGNIRAMEEILKEQEQRSPGSPLLVYDALQKWLNNDVEGAKKVLEQEVSPDVSVGHGWKLFQAFLASQSGEINEADRFLQEVEDLFLGHHKTGGYLLGVRAARIRLQVDIESELKLAELLRSAPEREYLLDYIFMFLPAADIVLPSLTRLLEFDGSLEVLRPTWLIPRADNEVLPFIQHLQKERSLSATQCLSLMEDFSEQTIEQWKTNALRVDTHLPEDHKLLILDLAISGYRRWKFAVNTFLLDYMSLNAHTSDKFSNPTGFSITTTLVAFRGSPFLMPIATGFISTDNYIPFMFLKSERMPVPPASTVRTELLGHLLNQEILTDSSISSEAVLIKEAISKLLGGQKGIITNDDPLHILRNVKDPQLFSVCSYLLGPDPLEMLCRQTLGLPIQFKL